MFQYSFWQWVLFFDIYCFAGWCIESAIVSFNTRRPVNRGFLRGPFLPIYGFGAVIILWSTLPVEDHPTLVFLCGMLGATVLEYVTGWLMEALFKTKYWDYSHKRIQLHGRICLTSSIFWGILALVLTYVLHKPVVQLVLSVNTNGLIVADVAVFLFLAVDLFYAVRSALDIRRLLDSITRLREELTELKTALTERVESNEHVAAMLAHRDALKEEYTAQFTRLTVFAKGFLKNNPTAHSRRFNETLAELRDKLAAQRSEKRKK